MGYQVLEKDDILEILSLVNQLASDYKSESIDKESYRNEQEFLKKELAYIKEMQHFWLSISVVFNFLLLGCLIFTHIKLLINSDF